MFSISKVLDEALSQSHIHMKHPGIVMEKLKTLIDGGSSSLQVISDFDMTISKYKHLSKRCPSSHNVLESNGLIQEDIKQQLHELKEKYHAIEIDHTLSEAEKTPFMIEWWSKAHEIFVSTGIKRADLKQSVSNSEIVLRDGCAHLLDSLHYHGIPLLIFSAGVGDVLEEVLRQKHRFSSNIKIISNFMNFNEEGTLVGFKGELIHTFNKNESALKHDHYFDELKHRDNIIIMGDMLGDLAMAGGVPNMNVCLKIGFLNTKFEELLEQFMDAFDIVLCDDQTMNVTNAILDAILDKGAKGVGEEIVERSTSCSI